jgi:hypothetical protein
MNKIIPILLCLFMTTKLYALSFYTVQYTVSPSDDFAKIIKKFVKLDAIINSKSPMIHKTRGSNPQISNWQDLKPGEKFKMYVSNDVIDMKKFKAFSKVLLKKKRAKLKKKNAADLRKKRLALRHSGYRGSAFYMASAGSFSQKSESRGINVDFTQNSPYTFGLSGLYYPIDKPYSFSTSIYYSNISPSSSNLSQSVIISAELGLNIYMQHDVYKYKFSYYGGFDYESFSTFNTGLLTTSNDIRMDENKVLYFTAGVSKLVKIGIPLFSKLSISKSLTTSTTTASGGTEPSKKYSGYKVMAYFNYKFHRRWFAHTLIKYHAMSGSDDLSVFRYGLGFGYIIR